VPFKGVLYCGLMLTPRGPMVLEYNARFGDPETQPILMRLQSDLLDAFDAVVDSRVDSLQLSWTPQSSLGVVLASGGYPEAFQSGYPITGLDVADGNGVKVFHAGTAERDGQVVTAGGRVLCATALGDTLPAAAQKAYSAASSIHFEGCYLRRDIGHRAMH
jgi:phosphoribosylamine--glycine ligase